MKKVSLKYILFLIMIVAMSCTRSPLKLYGHKRFYDGFFSGLSRNVIWNSAPEITDNSMYLGTAGGKLIKYDLKKKKVLWKFSSGSTIYDSPLADGDSIFFGNSEGTFYSIDDKDGSEKWSYKAEGEVISRAATNSSGMIFFTSADGTLTALDKKSGEWLWHYKRDIGGKVSVKGISSPLLIGNEAVIAGFADGYLSALNQNDGSPLWELALSKEGRFLDVDAIGIYQNSRIIIPTYEDGLYCLDKNGKTIWRFERGGATSKILQSNDDIYFASNNGSVYRIKAQNGEMIWQGSHDGIAPTNPLLLGESLVFADYAGGLFVFDSQNGERLWRYNLSGQIRGNIVPFKNKVLLITSRGHMFILGE